MICIKNYSIICTIVPSNSITHPPFPSLSSSFLPSLPALSSTRSGRSIDGSSAFAVAAHVCGTFSPSRPISTVSPLMYDSNEEDAVVDRELIQFRRVWSWSILSYRMPRKMRIR